MTIWYRIKYGAEWWIIDDLEQVDAHVRAMILAGKNPKLIKIVVETGEKCEM